jgi:hypothetical protein
MATRSLLDLQVWCIWSGIVINGVKIKPHKIQVVQCANKTLFSMCTVCKMRAFTCNWNLIAEVMKCSHVLKMTEKPMTHNKGDLR